MCSRLVPNTSLSRSSPSLVPGRMRLRLIALRMPRTTGSSSIGGRGAANTRVFATAIILHLFRAAPIMRAIAAQFQAHRSQNDQ